MHQTSTADIIELALALAPAERQFVADRLRESLENCSASDFFGEELPDIVATSRRRAAELAEGKVQGRPFEEVMEAARRVFK